MEPLEFIVFTTNKTHYIRLQILQDYPDGGLRVTIPKWDSPQTNTVNDIVRNKLEEGMYVEADLGVANKTPRRWYIQTIYRYGYLEEYIELDSTPIS